MLSRKSKSATTIRRLANALQFGPGTSFGNAGHVPEPVGIWHHAELGEGPAHACRSACPWDHTQLNIINNNIDTDIIEFKTFLNFVEGAVRTGIDTHRVHRLGQSLLSLRHRRRVRQRQLQSPQQSDRDLGPALGLRRTALGEIRQAYRVQRQPVFLRRRHGHHHQFGPRNCRQQSELRHAGRERHADEEPPVGLRAAHRHRLESPTSEADRAHRIRHLLRPRRILQLSLAQRRRRLQRTVRRHSGAAFRSARMSRKAGATFSNPFGTTPPPRPAGSAGRVPGVCCRTSRRPNPAISRRAIYSARSCSAATTSTTSLPYTENWTFDLQYQAADDWLFSAGYVGNHGVHEILPIPFNQPQHRHAAASDQRPDLFLRRQSRHESTRSQRWSRSPPANTRATRPSACPISATT